MSMIKPDLGIAIIPGKLFLHIYHKKPADTIIDHYFMFDELGDIRFDPISKENGPSTLSSIARFIKLIKDKLFRITKQIHICCSLAPESRVNCIFLLCVFIIVERKTVNEVLLQQKNKINPGRRKNRELPNYDDPLSIFQDVYPPLEEYTDAINSPFTMTISDVLKGFLAGYSRKWFNHETFDVDVYEFYLATENGFMTWIIPSKLLVLASPGVDDAPTLMDLLPLFRKWGIRRIVSFTGESNGFDDLKRIGIEWVQFEVAQESLPTLEDVIKFINLCKRDGATAICSLNGMGRGPTLAAMYLIYEHGLNPKEAISWTRIARQGAIYGVQQDFIVRTAKTLKSSTI